MPTGGERVRYRRDCGRREGDGWGRSRLGQDEEPPRPVQSRGDMGSSQPTDGWYLSKGDK